MNRSLPFFVCALLIALPAGARNIPFPRAGLEISCSLSDKDNPLKEYQILILEDDTVRDTIFADLAIHIYIQLELNKSYVLEFSKPGFLERLVMIDTKVPAGKEKRRYSYEFEIDMPYMYKDTGVYAIQPIARIIYDSASGEFTYDAEYARQIGNMPTMKQDPEPQHPKWPSRKKNAPKVSRKQ